ncbi:hypothetical protein [Methylobacterium mesophilicum]|uniref:hypothetical protein n=1 Tax=Methylobacterium mesophilicum TaxID=39956 RepID=UPI002F33A1CC
MPGAPVTWRRAASAEKDNAMPVTTTFTNPDSVASPGTALIGRADARSVVRPAQSPEPREARRSRGGLDRSGPECSRRRTGRAVSALLKRTQADRLALIGARDRAMAADDPRNLLLERLGLIRRIGDPRPHHLRGQALIDWTITEAGTRALRDIGIAGRAL